MGDGGRAQPFLRLTCTLCASLACQDEDSTVAIDLVFTGEPVMDEATGEQKWPPASALTVALPTTSPMDRAEVRLWFALIRCDF